MRKSFLILLAWGLWSHELNAQNALESITVATEPDSAGSSAVALCCTPLERAENGEDCSYLWTRPAEGATSVKLSIKRLCNDLGEKAQVVAQGREWIIAQNSERDKPLFLVDCQSSRARWIGPSASSTSAASVQESKPPESPVSSGDNKNRQPVAEKLHKRLDGVEKALKEQQSAVQGLQEEIGKLNNVGQRDFEKKLEALRRELLDRLRALEEAQKNNCHRIDDQYKGQDEVMVAVAGSVLRFVKVKPRASTVAIGFSQAKADELLAEAQARSSREIFPHILLAVPEVVREVKPFFLQDRLIDPQLYSRLTHGKDARRVAYQDVERFIAELNSRCSGRAKFGLPTEEQFVAVAQWLYDPVANGLKPCEAAREQDRRFEVTELLGHAWQLTRSLCVPFSDPPRATCPDGSSYIRKGGAASSTNGLECMPEYRSPAPFDVHQKETSFRLALLE